MRAFENIFPHIPRRTRGEIEGLASTRGVGMDGISEIRLRAFGKSSLIIGGERIFLATALCESELARCFSSLCDGSLYSKRDSIKEGYISLPCGVRVGIAGRARYDGGELVGISDVSTLVFRIPTSSFTGSAVLYEAWRTVKRGMLIYSPPAVGKTTALRALVELVGCGRSAENVVVVDERCEFLAENYLNSTVDILRGYRRGAGMEIALRTLSPDVIAVDEIGRSEETLTMLESLNSGVKLIATAHAAELSELMQRVNIKPLIENRVFDVAVGITLSEGRRKMNVEKLA